MIAVVRENTQTGLAKIIFRTETQTQDGVSRIAKSANQTQQGRARIVSGNTDWNLVPKPSDTNWSKLNKPAVGVWTPISKPFK
jgi:hypothetical protein